MANNNKPKAVVGSTPGYGFKLRQYMDRRLLGGFLLVILIIAAVILLVKYHHNSTKFNVNYKGTQSYKLPGSQPGRGMVFDRPSVFSRALSQTSNLATFVQGHEDRKSPQAIVISQLRAGANDYFKGPTPTLVSLVNQYMTAAETDSGYQGVVGNAQNFARDAFQAPNQKITFGHAAAFTNANITKNAWQFDLNVSQPNGPQPTEKGKLLFMIGQHTAYYFLVTAVDKNWGSNSQFFQGIINSVKIDQ
jgi:hypothetical protein